MAFQPHPMSLVGGIDRCDANNPILIPKLDGYDKTTAPGWFPTRRYQTEEPLKPLIRCKCGITTGIGLHHVHADGRVTNSFYDSKATEFTHKGKKYHHPPGCGWHVFIKLADYDQGDFPPRDE
jgi:hypothetical protein